MTVMTFKIEGASGQVGMLARGNTMRGHGDTGTRGGKWARYSAKVQIATGSLCKSAKVKQEGDRWTRGQGDRGTWMRYSRASTRAQ